MMLGLTASAHPMCTTPTYLAIKDLPLAERLAEMRKPEVRAAMTTEEPLNPTNPLIGFTRRYHRMFPTGNRGQLRAAEEPQHRRDRQGRGPLARGCRL